MRLLSMLILAVLIQSYLCGCSTGQAASESATPSRPAAISHVVFFKLHDAAQSDALLSDCDRLLPGIPGVISYAAGRHLDTGRATVDSDYDVGLYIGFETADAYQGYVSHEQHVALVEAWRDRLDWYRVYDVLDETP